MSVPRVAALGLVLLLLAPAFVDAQSSTTGRRVEFQATRFDDTLFAAVDTAFRVAFDADGDLWYSTQAGVVHVDVESKTRELFTHREGLPSSYALGLAIKGDHVYVATDLGLAIIDRLTGAVTQKTPLNSPLPDPLVQEVAVVGDDVWLGTYFHGVAKWTPGNDTWEFKNTSTKPGVAKPVRRIVASGDTVWVATEGNGAWRYDASQPFDVNASWRVLLKEDGLPSDTVLSVAQRGANTYFGTDKGLARWAPNFPDSEWLMYNKTQGMPDERVLDIDVIPTANGTLDVFAATREGVWQLEVESGRNVVRAQDFGILGDYVFDNVYSSMGWAFATQRGISLLRGGEWSYYTTGPSEGASPGPVSFLFNSASTGDNGDGLLWFGATNGVSAFYPDGAGGRGLWFNLGEWQYYPGSVVNHIDADGGMVWIATNKGVFGFDPATGRWESKLASAPSRNLVYGVDAENGELWIALFGDGLLMQNLTTGTSRSWDATSLPPLPDLYLTDVRVQGDDVWLGASIGVIRMNRLAGTITASYGVGDGLPGSGIVFRTLPDGGVVWVAMKDGGIARLDVASGKVNRVWNATTTEGFPAGEVRSLHREGGRLWVGTTEGLARIDIASGNTRIYNTTNSGLVQNYVNGILSADGILYLATLSGVARFDIARGEFLPMRDGVDVVRGTPGGSVTSPLVVRIESPLDGRAVTGDVAITGTASKFGATVDQVEVRIGDDGEWQPADGTARWRFDWDTRTAPRGQVTIAARAVSGNETSREVEILVTVVDVPSIPLTVQHEPPATANAGRAFPITVVATGEEPLTVAAFYKKPGQDSYTRLLLSREGTNNFKAAISARDVKEGELTYYVEARSGLLVATSPDDPTRPHRVAIGPPPSLAVAVEGPARVVALAGETTTFDLNVTNTGSTRATFALQSSGLRGSWITLPSAPLDLGPGESTTVIATLGVPPTAFSDETNFTFVATDIDGVAEPAVAVVPVSVQSTQVPETPVATPEKGRTGFQVPGPSVLLVLAAAALVAFAHRRRSS